MDSPYTISKEHLADQLKHRKILLPLKRDTPKVLQQKINHFSFPDEKENENAVISHNEKKFVIIPEKLGTTIDRKKLLDQLIADLENDTLKKTYPLSDFYVSHDRTKKQLQEKQKQLNQRLGKTIVTLPNKKITLTNQQLFSSVDQEGYFQPELLVPWISELERTYSTIYQNVRFKTIHGEKRQFKNIGNYGWFVDIQASAKRLAKKLNDTSQKNISLVIQGDPKKQPLNVTKDYIEVDLNQQRMYCFREGKRLVSTDIITGQYNKHTATVPGFHTIMDKQKDVSLSGELISGDGSYSVPVGYWMPFLSHGQTITEIGIHDTDHKLEAFGDKEAYRKGFGSYGCVNTPGKQVAKIFQHSYIGMPVFVYGDIYDDAPGEFDKPVDHGTVID
ncbi:hypothetical protein NRIC_02410 [Enterococcus florum]|uniref:L,D-TPase catalytic domain-containing protein n=1 Tax=Enterococcus florum TaxID=2480627 RepID=A0A4P5P428_9ENTE|nr:hypothetical protein NRIC_02410 [Enterococcus florum]